MQPELVAKIREVNLRAVAGWAPVQIKFGTSGWRSLQAETKNQALKTGESKSFTAENVQLVTQAIADHLKAEYQAAELARGLIVSHGTREDGNQFARPAAAVLAANGIKVLLVLGYTPTPVSSFTIQHQQALAGIHITASHNPYNSVRRDNGLKFTPAHGGPAPVETTTDLEERIKEKMQSGPIFKTIDYALAKAAGLIVEEDVLPAYQTYLRSLIDFVAIKKSAKKVFVDAMHGSSARCLAEILAAEDVAWQVFRPAPLHEVVATLPADYRPEPDEDHLPELIAAVKAAGGKGFGIANDEDADRGGQVDARGNFITPNQAGGIYLWYLYKYKQVPAERLKAGVAKTVVTTNLINALAAKINIPLYETPVGFKHFVQYPQTVLKLEESAHFSGLDWQSWDDGILEGLSLLQIEVETGKSLAKILAEAEKFVGRKFIYGRNNYSEQEGLTPAMTMTKKLKEFTELAVAKVITLDGMKLLFTDGSWLAFRSSGTEPVVRTYAEASTKAAQKSLAKLGKKLLGIN